MSMEEFIIWVYCWVDDHSAQLTKGKKLRQRGFPPKLSDAEVITMELVGEFQGFDEDKGIWEYFSHHWRELFPTIGSRSQFAKQAMNLWVIKQLLQHAIARELGTLGDPVHLVDGFPLPVSHFKRAKRCCRFKGVASYGYCASKNDYYYGFEGHILLDFRGAIAGFTLTPAHEGEREAVWELVEFINGGLLLGDKGYLGLSFQKELLDFKAIELETPVRSNMTDKLPKQWRGQLNKLRQRVETTIGQLVERFNIERTKSRTLWSLTNRLTRKMLSHSLGVLANCQLGNSPLKLEKVIQA